MQMHRPKQRAIGRTATAATLIVALLASGAAGAAGRRGPSYLHVEPDGGKLLVLCGKSGTIARVDPITAELEAETQLDETPFALTRHPDGKRLYVSCRRGQSIVELDARSLAVLRRFPLLGDPTGVAVSADGQRLYAGVHSLDLVALFDIASGKEIKRLAVGNGPEMVRLAAREGLVYVTNLMSNPFEQGQPCRNEITVIDDRSARVVERVILENANVGRHIDFAPDGSFAVAAISRPKNLVPMAQVARGWVVTNGFVVLRRNSATSALQLLVDLPNRSYADPYAVAITPDSSKFYLTAAGSDTVLAIDWAKVAHVADEVAAGGIPAHADDLGLSRRYVMARISVGANPQALAISSDGKHLYVANRLDDSVSVIDTATDSVIRTIVLGTPPPVDVLHEGEIYFNSAARTVQSQFSCASCHPDEGLDGLRYDMEPDGLGEDILDNRNMRDVDGTEPFKWVGTNPDIATQCGTRTAKWIVRTGWLSSAQVMALVKFIHSIPPVVNPYLAPDGKLTRAQRRGQEFFERTVTNAGKPIPQRDQCHFCHSGPKFTNHQKFDVGTQSPTDRKALFDSAHLINAFESAPYLHDGRARTLEEMWTKYNPHDKHGISSDWTKQQLNDLVEYLKAIGPPKDAP